mmetsp:Transcript_8072/g.19300  ORF Transcript_8072/g.19300 Transcript_8072/m.19300 type:complete len:222 (-) Transcript_8072:71-736(-)
MVVGLGTGSTAKYATERIAERLKSGELKNIVGLATSTSTRQLAERLAIPLGDINTYPVVDVTIDGADEVAPNLDLVKGRMGGLLRKKMIGQASRRYVCIADETKLVKGIGGSKGPVPVEVTKYGHEHVKRAVQRLFGSSLSNCEFKRTEEGKLFVTDHGNYILYLYFDKPLRNPRAAARSIVDIVGVLDHGLFLDLADVAVIATNQGLKVFERKLDRCQIM